MKDELLKKTGESLLEMREAVAGLFRVISSDGETITAMEEEFKRIGLKEGFGKRADEILADLHKRGILVSSL